MDIRGLLAYSDACRAALRETLAAHPGSLHAPFETTSAFQSIAQLIAHMIGAEQRWTVQRLKGEEGSLRYEDHAASTLDGLYADWDAVRTRLRAFIEWTHDPSHPSGLHRSITYSLPQWNINGTMTVEQTLFHVFNHQTYHFGQVSMALQRQGLDPPNFDYCLLGVTQ